MCPKSLRLCSGLPGALPGPGAHHAVPARERQQGAPVDSGERGARDLSAAAGTGVLPPPPRFRSGRHGDAPPLPQPGGGVHRPQEPQVRDAAPVRDLSVREPRETQGHNHSFFVF